MGGRRRSRRDEQLFEVAAVDPVLHQRLVELRQRSPAAFRKELARLVRQGVIPATRQIPVAEALLALVRLPLGRALAELAESERRDELSRRAVEGLIEEEASNRARPAVLDWLDGARARVDAP